MRARKFITVIIQHISFENLHVRRDDDGTMGFDVYNTHTMVDAVAATACRWGRAYFFGDGGGQYKLSKMPPPSVATITPKLHDVGIWMW